MKFILDRLSSAWSDVKQGRNLELYICLILAVAATILAIFSRASSELTAAVTLMILALLATSLLTTRHLLQNIASIVSPTVDRFFLENYPPSLDSEIEHATHIWLVGEALNATILRLYPVLERKLAQGATIRVLLINPDSRAVDMAEQRNPRRQDPERFRATIREMLRSLCDLREHTNGNLQIKTVDAVLEHGTIAIDPDLPIGIMYIKNYTFRIPSPSMPIFVLTAKEPLWYNQYKQELKDLMSTCSGS